MQSAKCKLQGAKCITLFLLMVLYLSGCGSGGGGSSQVIEVPPAAPTGVKVVVSGSSELVISWNSVANTTSYNIYWSKSSGVSKANGYKLSSITNSYTHTGLTNGDTYYYVVTAINSYGESSESAEAYATLNVPTPPGAVAAVAGDRQVRVSWNTNGAISYNIYMASQPGVTKSNGTLLPNVASPYIVTPLQNGMPYYFVVTSINSFGEGGESNEVSATPATTGNLTVTGSVRYEDKEYGTGGFTGKTSYKAVRYAEVQAVEDVTNGATIATSTTDAFGSYTLTIPPAYSSKAIYIRAISSALSPSISVKDLSNSNALYTVAGPTFTASGAAMANISIPTASPAAGAFNILDVYTSGALFIKSLSGSYPPALTAFWQIGNPKGTYYCSGTPDPSCPYGEGIYIMNYNGDTDEYDDDVLLHEFGHFIANHFSKDDSPGGVHYLTSNDLDLRLSWSEGWGNFFPTAVKTWLNTANPALLSTAYLSYYIDTAGGTAPISVDFSASNGSPYIYSTNEVAVANILLKLRDSFGMPAIWNIITSFPLTYPYPSTPVNLEAFWDEWLKRPTAASEAGTLKAIFSPRAIDYSPDTFESQGDNSFTTTRSKFTVSATSTEYHTIYNNGDIDYVPFDAVSGNKYTITTTNLRNGADTLITLYNPDQTVTNIPGNPNDNASGQPYTSPFNCSYDQYGRVCHENGYDTLGSKISFTASFTGTYFVGVTSSPNRPLSAGRYGGYSLTITSP